MVAWLIYVHSECVYGYTGSAEMRLLCIARLHNIDGRDSDVSIMPAIYTLGNVRLYAAWVYSHPILVC